MDNHKFRRISFLVGLCLTLWLVFPASGQVDNQDSSHYPPIRLKAGTFTPAHGERLLLAPGLTIDPSTLNTYKAEYYIVQFSGPIQQAWLEQVSRMSGEIKAYLPDYAFKVRMTPAIAAEVRELSEVIWVGLFQPGYKLSPSLVRNGVQLYKLRLESKATKHLVNPALQETGVTIIRQEGNFLVVAATSNQVNLLARSSEVAWIENFHYFEKHNEYAAGAILGANTANANGYDGSSQIVAVADSGLGGGTPTTAHPDIPSSRITTIQDFSVADIKGCIDVFPNGAQDVDSGHGTHTALSVVGDGGASGEGKGAAPAAHLVFQAVEDYTIFYGACSSGPDGYVLIGIPSDLANLFQPAYNAGARIHSNSWGSEAYGDYTLDSASADAFIWNHKDFLITFSAGNEGTDANSDGVVDNDSMGSPATAKNVLSVGASENDRLSYPCDVSLSYTSHDGYQSGHTCSSMSGQNLLGTYGQRWPDDFPVGTIASDITAGNREQMAAFSSRGPTDDGRIKPDVVAPGTWVLSGYSSMYQEGYGDPVNPQNDLYQVDGWGMPLNEYYKYFGGTSMANPLAAGAATVVRDFYSKAYAHNASAALVKATLINSAVDILDENNDGLNDNDYPIPNVHEGWGRINLANATDGSHHYIDNITGLGTGEVISYTRGVASTAIPLKISLVWSDYPSTETAALNLVNDLDLEVRSPDGASVYLGNVFDGGWSQTGGSADSLNNVENVYVQSPALGVWTIIIRGDNVPSGPQPFALVVDGDLQSPTAVTITHWEAVSEIGSVLLTWGSAPGKNLLGFNINRAEAPDNPGTRLNQELIDSLPFGGDYAFRDSSALPGVTYLYWIEIIEGTKTTLLEQRQATALLGLYLPIVQ